MALLLWQSDKVLLARWAETPGREDLARFDEAVRCLRQRAGRALVVVAILPEGMPLPPPAIRGALIKRMLRLRRECASMHAVVEGRGLRATVARTFLQGLTRVLRVGHASVHGHARQVAEHPGVRAALGLNPADALREWQRQGLLG